MRRLGSLIAICASASIGASAWAQSPPQGSASSSIEGVIVTAPRISPEAAIHDFVQSLPLSLEPVGKIARWRRPICPIVTGLPSNFGKFVLDQVMRVAAGAGAPLGGEGCQSNVDIVFTSDPQGLMDSVREKSPTLLGYHDVSQTDAISTVNRAVQSWYTTETADIDGTRTIDSGQRNRGVSLFVPPSLMCRTGCTVNFSEAREMHVTGSRLTDTLRSELFHVIITVDLRHIAGMRIGELSNYIALLALVTSRPSQACQPLPSIANLLANGCSKDQRPEELSPYDLAFLRAVYRMDTYASLPDQRSAIVDKIMRDMTPR
jgi:hypothetical protein